MTRWDDKRGAEDHRAHKPPGVGVAVLCVICGKHRAKVGEACRACFDGLLTERRSARRQARRKIANGEAG